MNVAWIVSWTDVLLLATAGGFYFFGFKRGHRIGEREAWKESYQNEINNKMEDFLAEQKKNG